MCGFANVISFKKIDNEQINYVENFIKTEMLDILSKDANDSFGGDCDAIIDHEIMVQHFGKRFSSCPSKFKFESGDRILIKELVQHVKKESDCCGILRFRIKKKKSHYHIRNIQKKNAASNDNKPHKNNIKSTISANIEFQSMRKKELFEKVKGCLNSYKIESDDFVEEMITLDVDGENIYGAIHCAVCKRSKKKSKPKRVFYHVSPESSYWVLSNFQKHLENVHSLLASKPVANRKKRATENTIRNNDKDEKANSSNEMTEIVSVHSDGHNSLSVDMLDDIIWVTDDTNNKENGSTSLLDQMCEQMKIMVSAVLNNGEDSENIDILVRKQPRRISVVKTNGDVNCLPSSLAHQLLNQPIGSKSHISNTNSLRSSVIEHILLPGNILRYRIAIEEHMKDINIKNSDESDCIEFVRDVLSKPNQWMGLETLKAVSNIYAVTIVIFNEDGACYAIRGDARNYEKTIVIAYRLGEDVNNQDRLIYNHYDSVVDIDANTLFDSAEFITKK